VIKEENFDFILKNTWQAVARMYNEEASKYDGTMGIGFALLNIDKLNGTSVSDLAAGLGIETTSITRLLNSMEEKKLILKKKNPKDGRGVIIYLTEFGLEKRDLSKKSVIQFNETIRENISEEDFLGFKNVTNKINELIEKQNIF
jgi:DNA-binding MarR family transcriptional regulator